MVRVASQGLLFGSGPTLTSGRQKAALVHGARWELRAYPVFRKDLNHLFDLLSRLGRTENRLTRHTNRPNRPTDRLKTAVLKKGGFGEPSTPIPPRIGR